MSTHTPLTPTTIAKLAKFAGLEIDATQIEHYLTDLEKIIDIIEQIKDIDTIGITPMVHPLAMQQPLRQDIPDAPNTQQLQNIHDCATNFKNDLYLVTQIK